MTTVSRIIEQVEQQVARVSDSFSDSGRSSAKAESAHQVALALSVGIAAGLMPKANLIALVLLLFLFLLRLNLAVGLLAVSVTTLISFALDPHLHLLGEWLLANEVLQPGFLAVLRLPFGPWTAINNTVVVGSLLVGAAQGLPTYWCTRTLLARQAARFQDHWLLRSLGVGSRPGWRI